MKYMMKLTLGAFFALTITNCSLFGGNTKETGEDSYEDAESVYEGAADESSEETSSSNYVAPDAYGDAENQSDKPPLNLDNEGYETDQSAQSDIAFGEGEDVPDSNSTSDLPAVDREMSGVNFKQGMYDFSEDCQMRDEATQNGSPAGMIRAGKKLWVEPVDNQWLRVYKKSGPVFISRSCL